MGEVVDELSTHGRDIDLWVDDVAECDGYAGDSEVESVVCGGGGERGADETGHVPEDGASCYCPPSPHRVRKN